MIQRALAILSLACCAVVMASFAMFARDQAATAARHQESEVAVPAGASAPSKPAGQPRRAIDSAATTLESPFRMIVSTRNPWLKRGVTMVLALLVYGLGLAFIARYSRGTT